MEIKEVTIPTEEYKELLIIKGKYEELKNQVTKWGTPLIREPINAETPYKITCKEN